MKFTFFTFLFLMLSSGNVIAEEFITTEPDNKTYQYVSSYTVEIDATPEKVWKHLEKLKSWMYEFDMSHLSGDPGKVGEVLRLYPGQEFLVQITGKVKNQTLTIANLPTTFNGEYSTGVGVINLTKTDEKTTVNFVMSRRYTWQGEGENAMKLKRESIEFQNGASAMWNKFLQKLKTLSESK